MDNEPAAADADEDDNVVARALAVETGASAASEGSSSDELAKRIAAGEFSSVSPLVTFFKPLRKQLAQMGAPGARPRPSDACLGHSALFGRRFAARRAQRSPCQAGSPHRIPAPDRARCRVRRLFCPRRC